MRPFELERYFGRHEFTAKHLLCCSDVETLDVRTVLSESNTKTEELLDIRLGYTESEGNPPLRSAIAESVYGGEVDASDVLVFAGAEEAIYVTMRTVLSPGDTIVVAVPCYTSLSDIAADMGVSVVPWVPDEEWKLDLASLARIVAGEDREGGPARMVVLMNPANPTGALLGEEDLRGIVGLCEDANCILFADEVYRGLEREGTQVVPSAAGMSESHVIALGVMSKAYGLAGLRVGWVATKCDQLYQALLQYKDYTSICVSATAQFLATAALGAAPSILERNRGIIAANMDALDAFMAKFSHLFSWVRPTASPVCFPRLNVESDSGITADAFCASLLESKSVLLLPGSAFHWDPRHFRLGYGRADMVDVLALVEEYLLDNHPQGALFPDHQPATTHQ